MWKINYSDESGIESLSMRDISNFIESQDFSEYEEIDVCCFGEKAQRKDFESSDDY
jgi:hypothetical protein